MSTSTLKSPTSIYHHPVELLQNLIRFNTTNPPGNEKECIFYVKQVLADAGIDSTILELDPNHPNLIARILGAGSSPPLLLQGHVDVVTTEKETWQYPPFEGKVIDGWVWGRGALDMKGGVAMMLAAFLQAKAESLNLPGDVILALMSDEEAGSRFGAKYLVEEHASYFKNVRYAIGEFGAFSFYVGKKKFYPIMIAEKSGIGILMTVRGPGGHPTVTHHNSAMVKLGQALRQLEKKSLPAHIITASRLMIQAMSRAMPFPANLVLRQLQNPRTTNIALTVFGKQLEQIFLR